MHDCLRIWLWCMVIHVHVHNIVAYTSTCIMYIALTVHYMKLVM